MLYEMMREPPAPGTPLESLMIMVWRSRQDIELQKTRAIVQAVLSTASESEEGNKQLRDSWQDFLDEMYPYQKGQRKSADKVALEYLKREAARGPMTVTPLQPLSRAKSRMRARYHQRESHESSTVSKMRFRKDRRGQIPS